MSWEKKEDEDELVITPKSALECCRIYTQHISEGKGAPVVVVEAFSVGLGAQVVDYQNFRVHFEDGNESDKEGSMNRANFATTSLD